MMACILVIDANPRIRAGVRHILAYAGYEVVDACDGGEGVREAYLHPIDLVIVGLHRAARVEAIRLLQSVWPAVKLLTMADDADMDTFPARHGEHETIAHRTIQKPVGAHDLLTTVQALLAVEDEQSVGK